MIMERRSDGEPAGPIMEKQDLFSRMARTLLGHNRLTTIDLSDLNDQNDPPGLSVTGETTLREHWERVKGLQDSGLLGPLVRSSRYSFIPYGEPGLHWVGMPLKSEGAPIVDAARGLRLRQEGVIPLGDGPVTRQGKALIEKSMRARGLVSDEPEL